MSFGSGTSFGIGPRDWSRVEGESVTSGIGDQAVQQASAVLAIRPGGF
jgi:hypothetical protein